MRAVLLSALLLALAPAPSHAAEKAKKTKKAPKDPAVERRIAALKAKGVTLVAVRMKPSDDPDVLPDSVGAGPVLVAGTRAGVYTPPILSSEDMLAVVSAEMKDVRRCYKAQLAADPEWSDELILDLSVKKTGRVSEVSIAPRRVERAEIGRCLLSAIPKWKFPAFTGELEDGVTQEVVTASFPFSFSVPN